ncbi:hypothetical protein CY34DRAFT_239028 [Suillus luteus UH-Slu-Lm8-n1]|uniref:Uncharacterized protein n=1 Tax=Suillus luteus UH-Slu-Lm8-n1 TaxID=930992 RepID=A0A0D0AGT4_9AGAM|nr:hypothetical protein CY34DRAFT_239028 [Suillus luteus UH-Slu-Lm8-n1]
MISRSNSLDIVLTKCHRTCLKCISIYSKTLTWLTCMYFQQASISVTCQRVFDSICFHVRDVDKTAWPSNVNLVASSFGYIRSTLITRVTVSVVFFKLIPHPVHRVRTLVNIWNGLYLFIARGLLLRFFVPSQSCRGPQAPVCLPREPHGMTGKFQHEGQSFQKPTSFEILSAH